MHKASEIFSLIEGQGIRFFTGVPDSLLKHFCAYVSDNTKADQHVITANEGNAVALAVGHYLGTGRSALVYMQNSGIGNAINPLLSLAAPEIYSVPMLLMIGWRSEPGMKDEPQHIKQGRVMTRLMDVLEIPWFNLKPDTKNPEVLISSACEIMTKKSIPVALLVSKGSFEKYAQMGHVETAYSLNREAAIKCIIDLLGENDIVVSTTGKTSRELYEYREQRCQGHSNDFLTVGSMGHAASIAMGVAQAQANRKVVCLDGDGSILMHMGALAIIGQSKIKNLLHVVINNGAHDSVGGQPTVGFDINLPKIAQACGYREAISLTTGDEVKVEMQRLRDLVGPVMLEIKARKGARLDLGRPKTSPLENRDAFMGQLGIKV